jgi:group I intron endonuclease
MPVNMDCGVYCIRNKVNGDMYIGASLNIHIRMKKHFRELIAGNHRGKHFQNSFNEFGLDNFVCETLIICDINMLHVYEGMCIRQMNSEYNYQKVTFPSPMIGRKLSEETKRKIGMNWKGRKHSEEAKNKISEFAKTRIMSSETKNKIAVSNSGKKHSDATKAKISASWKHRTVSEETKEKMSNAWKHRIVSEETKEKMRISYRIRRDRELHSINN